VLKTITRCYITFVMGLSAGVLWGLDEYLAAIALFMAGLLYIFTPNKKEVQ
jgi:hypothetical protein